MIRYILIGVLVGVLAGCAARGADEAPVQTVRDFLAAWEARDVDAIFNLIEPAPWRREIGPELRSYAGLVEEVAFVNPKYTVLEQSAAQASVQVETTVRYTLRGGRSGERDLNVIVDVVQRDGQWYVRGLDLDPTTLLEEY
ncbi:MAG: hypothetical protein HC876_13510 [Chloroflexaceae bacterium]|nr:hypothetical protein [Chloroflexaceae bacterium]NJO06452.1 hypothetical protein [Chloroflexaceae bacterium]